MISADVEVRYVVHFERLYDNVQTLKPTDVQLEMKKLISKRADKPS